MRERTTPCRAKQRSLQSTLTTPSPSGVNLSTTQAVSAGQRSGAGRGGESGVESWGALACTCGQQTDGEVGEVEEEGGEEMVQQLHRDAAQHTTVECNGRGEVVLRWSGEEVVGEAGVTDMVSCSERRRRLQRGRVRRIWYSQPVAMAKALMVNEPASGMEAREDDGRWRSDSGFKSRPRSERRRSRSHSTSETPSSAPLTQTSALHTTNRRVRVTA